MYLCFIYLFLFKHSLQRSYTLTVGPFWNPVSQETEERLLCGTKMVLRESDVAPLVRYYRSVHAVVSLCLQTNILKCIMSVSRVQFYSWCYTKSLDFFLYDTTNKILWLVSSQVKRLSSCLLISTDKDLKTCFSMSRVNYSISIFNVFY